MEALNCWLSTICDWLEAHSGAIAAVATVFIAWFTITLSRSTNRLWGEAKVASRISYKASRAAKKSADAAEKAFLSANRPRIRLKHLWFTYDDRPDMPSGISFAVVNAGTTTARITEFNIATRIIRPEHSLPQLPQFATNQQIVLPPKDVLESGITLLFEKAISGAPMNEEEYVHVIHRSRILHCYGYVEYADLLGGIRKTAFHRILHMPVIQSVTQELGKWEKGDNSDYEYED